MGTLHAWLITCVGLPPFIATLATLVTLAHGNLFTVKITLNKPNGSLMSALSDPRASMLPAQHSAAKRRWQSTWFCHACGQAHQRG